MSPSLLSLPPIAHHILRGMKDDFYLKMILKMISEIIEKNHILSLSCLDNYSPELHALSQSLYFGCTTGKGILTIGEEYIGIHSIFNTYSKKTNGQHFILKSNMKEHVWLWSTIVCMYMYDRNQKGWEALLPVYDTLPERMKTCFRIGNVMYQKWKSRVVDMITTPPPLESVKTFVISLQLSFLYVYGKYPTFSHYLFGRLYTIYPMQLNGIRHQETASFRLLGYLIWTRLLVSLISRCTRLGQNNTKDSLKVQNNHQEKVASIENNNHTINISTGKCSLCLEVRKNAIVTPCGHVFDWNCMIKWCQKKPECPHCRQKVLPQSLRCLYGY